MMAFVFCKPLSRMKKARMKSITLALNYLLILYRIESALHVGMPEQLADVKSCFFEQLQVLPDRYREILGVVS
ncbi:MAG: hypothetical protein U0L73_14550, partial [Ruminococcus bromii]|nr:hypothetical protein [Ruminococcus bromii]